MQIGIIGSGNVGTALARVLVDAGHEVAISNSRGPASLVQLVGTLGPSARAATVEEAVAFGAIVIEAIPFVRYRDLPATLLAGKIVVTASNYHPWRDGKMNLGGFAQSELVAHHLVGARVVKAFNTIWFHQLIDQRDRSKPIAERRAIFLSGDDQAAKDIVAALIEEIGFGPLDLGSLRDSTRQEPGSLTYDKQLTVAQARALLAA